MRVVPFILSRFLPLACLAFPACAPRGIMTYKRTEVTGRPHFRSGSGPTAMQIVDVSRPKGETIFWNDRVLDHRGIDTSRRYRFELEEGTAVSEGGIEYKSSAISRVYDDQRLIYDASICRVHALAMPRTRREWGDNAEDLPGDYDSVKPARFPNSKFDHAACNTSAYSVLDWNCPQCSEAETVWLEKNPKRPNRCNPGAKQVGGDNGR